MYWPTRKNEPTIERRRWKVHTEDQRVLRKERKALVIHRPHFLNFGTLDTQFAQHHIEESLVSPSGSILLIGAVLDRTGSDSSSHQPRHALFSSSVAGASGGPLKMSLSSFLGPFSV